MTKWQNFMAFWIFKPTGKDIARQYLNMLDNVCTAGYKISIRHDNLTKLRESLS